MKINHVFGKLSHKIIPHLDFGLGIEKSLVVKVSQDYFKESHHYYGRTGFGDGNGGVIIQDFDQRWMDESKTSTASQYFHLKSNPTTIIFEFTMSVDYRIVGPLGANLSAGYRFYANPFPGTIGKYAIAKLALFSCGINYTFGKVKKDNT